MPEISKGLVERILSALKPPEVKEAPEEARIVVHAAVSRFAFLYERIRNAVDYKDEHLLRKSAVIRILKRQLLLERDPQVVAKNLIRELIGARYLPNGELPESLISQVAKTVDKYIAVERIHAGSSSHLNWLLRLAAVEIEEVIVDSARDKELVAFLYERLADRVTVQGALIEDSDLKLQIYLACHRTLIKADADILGYKLLRAFLPEWLRSEEWRGDPCAMAERLIGVERRIKLNLNHPLAQKFNRAVKPWAVALNSIWTAVLDKPDEATELFEKPEALDAAVSRVAERSYKAAKTKLRRGSLRAMIYLFITKMLVAFAVEVPIEYWMYQGIAKAAFTVNLLFPPTLMFFVWLLIRLPGKDNTARIQDNARMLLSSQGVPAREIRVPRKRGLFARVVFRLVYAATFFIIFGSICLLLAKFKFTWVSSLIFLFFLCLVSFFAFRLRQNAREFVIVEGKDSFSSVLMDFVSLPILRAGQWLSRGIAHLNVFLFFFDFLFEAPFKMLLSVLEEWFAFMKEKKEELQ